MAWVGRDPSGSSSPNPPLPWAGTPFPGPGCLHVDFIIGLKIGKQENRRIIDIPHAIAFKVQRTGTVCNLTVEDYQDYLLLHVTF